MPVLNYSMSMKLALEEGPPYLRCLAPFAVAIVNGFVLTNQLSVCSLYIVFVATNFKSAVDKWYILSIECHMLLWLLPLLLLMCVRNLQRLAPFSIFANVVTSIGIGIIFYHTLSETPSINERNAAGHFLQMPIFLRTALFALVAVAVKITLENNMKTPKSFTSTFGVLNTSMTSIVLLYIAFGFMGYLKYGENIQSSITLNLPPERITTTIVQFLFAIATFISYGLHNYISIDIIWNNYLSKRLNGHVAWEMVIRFSIVLITFLMALVIRNLGLFSLFGALCLSMLGVAFPALIELCVLYPFNLGRYNYIFIRNVTLIVIGVLALITGTSKSISDLIQYYS